MLGKNVRGRFVLKWDMFHKELGGNQNDEDKLDRKTKVLCEICLFSQADVLSTFKSAFPVVVSILESRHQNQELQDANRIELTKLFLTFMNFGILHC